jgi:hypothetical protein
MLQRSISRLRTRATRVFLARSMCEAKNVVPAGAFGNAMARLSPQQ